MLKGWPYPPALLFPMLVEVSLEEETLLVAWKLQGSSSNAEGLTFSYLECVGGIMKE